jgi:hypothetical protein
MMQECARDRDKKLQNKISWLFYYSQDNGAAQS